MIFHNNENCEAYKNKEVEVFRESLHINHRKIYDTNPDIFQQHTVNRDLYKKLINEHSVYNLKFLKLNNIFICRQCSFRQI